MAASNRISFQGEPGANSDTACRNMFPEMEPLPCPTFEDAFNAVESGAADLAMIPIENTIAGRVADIHHLLPESRLHIVGATLAKSFGIYGEGPILAHEEVRPALERGLKVVKENRMPALVDTVTQPR